jgi:hypothetical protein
MIEIDNDKDTIILKFSKTDVSEEFYRDLIDRIQFESLVNKADFNEEFINLFSEDIKKEWWENNKSWIYEKIGKPLENNS